MSNTATAQGSSSTPEDTARRHRVARELLAEADAIAALLANNDAALGSEEVKFLSRLRDSLIARAGELCNVQTAAPARPAPAAAPAAPAQISSESPGSLDLARTVVVCYLMFLFAFLGYLFAKSHLMRVDVTGDIVEMFKVFLLPTVMLVLGFFFGASRR
jgi:hypothetical protein